MDQQKIMDEIEYYKAQAITELLYTSGKITFDEYDKLTDLNRKTFSPLYADLLPKPLEKSSNQSSDTILTRRESDDSQNH